MDTVEILTKARELISALKPHPTSSDEAAGEYCNARNDALLILDEAVENLSPEWGAQLLSSGEKRAQAARCSCLGSDDYCPCQNTPDNQTIQSRAIAAARES